ncbi:MAG: hypothetical protein IPN76_23360 [Saprospiraceae bacterium]|nr:hypothetical protein [Saprospiraceae bacterium]
MGLVSVLSTTISGSKNLTTAQFTKRRPFRSSYGAFARIKPFQNFFAHFEYEHQSTESIDPDQDGRIVIGTDDKIVTGRIPYNNTYIGAGYNSGSLWAYELMILYNLNHPESSFASPFSLRFGLTYKF